MVMHQIYYYVIELPRYGSLMWLATVMGPVWIRVRMFRKDVRLWS